MNEFLQRFTVGKRMFAGFGFLLLLMAAIAVVSATSLSTLEKHLETIAVERVTKTALANTLYDSANLLNINMQAMILAESEEERLAAQQRIQETRANFVATYQKLEAMPAREEGKRLLAAINKARVDAAPLNDHVAELALEGNIAEATTYLNGEAGAGLKTWREAVNAYVEREARQMKAAHDEAWWPPAARAPRCSRSWASQSSSGCFWRWCSPAA